ncbi:MAG: MarR family winged helix-turn-helix transcriptional regulator [Candidatus Methylomirabilaceae bacterium]
MAVRVRVHQRRLAGPAEAAAVSLMIAADHLQQAFGAVCARHGITGDQYNVLRILRGAHPRGHPRGEVARRCVHRSPDVTRMLDRLVSQGLATRVRDPQDRRCSVATITKAGLALLGRIDPEIAAETRRLTKSLTGPQLEQLARLTDALVR